MKRIALIFLVIGLLVGSTTAAMALNTPTVRSQHGVITGLYSNIDGFVIGLEYGLNKDLAIFGSVGMNSELKAGGKFELQTNTLALVGGVSNIQPFFLGLNIGSGIAKDLTLAGEVDVYVGNNFAVGYDLGLKYNLNKQLDIRGGLTGRWAGTNVIGFQLGIGLGI